VIDGLELTNLELVEDHASLRQLPNIGGDVG
jgi:hypothetical protein